MTIGLGFTLIFLSASKHNPRLSRTSNILPPVPRLAMPPCRFGLGGFRVSGVRDDC
jgi:hypothetical protein